MADQTGGGVGGGRVVVSNALRNHASEMEGPRLSTGRLEGMGVGGSQATSWIRILSKTTLVGRFHYHTQLRSLGPTSSDLV